MNADPAQSHKAASPLPRWHGVALSLTILLAFALRLHALSEQPLWSAEGLTLYRAGLPFLDLLRGQLLIGDVMIADGAGPLFPLLLSMWRSLLGDPAEIGRLLAVWLGLLAVPLIYRFGRTILNARVALGAAILLALSPYHVWLSREMAPQTAMLLCTLVAALAGWHLLTTWRAARRLSWPALALAGVALLIAALASPALRDSPDSLIAIASTGSLPAQAASLLGAGVTQNLTHQWWRYAPALILALAGIVANWRRRPAALAYLLIYLMLPLALLWLSPSTNRAGRVYQFVLLALPPFLLLAAAGWLHPWRRWRGRALALGGLMIILQIVWLQAGYQAPELRSHDIRALARQVGMLANGEDLILIEDPATALTFDHYYRGDSLWLLLPSDAERSWEMIQPWLQDASPSGARVWLLQNTQTPAASAGLPLSSGAEDWPQLGTLAYDGMWLPPQLALYSPAPVVSELPEDVPAQELDWAGELALAGFSVPQEAASGALWQPDFYWRKGEDAAGQYTLFLRLLDESGRTWSVQDWLLWEEYPPGVWPGQELLRYQPLWRLPAGLPPGNYQAWLQLVRTSDGELLRLSDGNGELLLTPNLALSPAVAPDGLPYLPEFAPETTQFGSELALLGHQLPAEESYRPGHPVPVTLYWQVNETPAADYRLRLQLLDREDGVIGEAIGPIVHPGYPPSRWSPDTLLVSQSDLLIPGSVPAGRYQIMAALLPPDGEEPLNAGGILTADNVKLADILVEPWPMESGFPPIQTSMRAEFDQPAIIELHGYALAPEQLAAGDTLSLTLYWRALQNVEENLAVFVHLTNPQGEVVAQGDGIPVNGFRPTTSWRAGEAIVDEHILQLPAELPEGDYSIWIGFYDPTSFERLPVAAAGKLQPDSRLRLIELLLAPD